MDEASREPRKLCAGMDKELVQLKRKHPLNSTIMQILNQFEPVIESVDTTETPAPAPRPIDRKIKGAG